MSAQPVVVVTTRLSVEYVGIEEPLYTADFGSDPNVVVRGNLRFHVLWPQDLLPFWA